MACEFCNLKKLGPRIFYKEGNWAAFLAAPYHTRGHTILIRIKKKGKCPQKLNKNVLPGMGCAIADVSKALMSCKYYDPKPKKILFASLRGDVEHFHIHLIPLWGNEEIEWREEQIENNHLCYEKGHLIEYLGNLERKGDKRASKERNEKGWTSEKQRKETIKNNDFKSYIDSLIKKTGYNPRK